MGPIEKTLRDAWELIKEPENRCVKHLAVDSFGRGVYTDSPTTCKFCCYGAINKAAGTTNTSHPAKKYLMKAAQNLFGEGVLVSQLNDTDPINNPPKIYTEAIRLAEEEGV